MSSPPRVLVTRSSRQASELADRLRALGLQPVLLPAIETVEPSSFAVLDHALANLESFHWLLFTSANGVDAFAQRRHARSETPATISPECKLRVAAIGPATARALEVIGVIPDLLPPQAVAESLTTALLPFARQPDGSATRFLLVRAEEGREHLPEVLRVSGAEVTVAPAYRTVVPEGSVARLRHLFSGSEELPEAITFTSSSTARNLLGLCEAAGVPLPATALRISIGPITTGTLRELGWPPHAEAAEATVAALAEAVRQAISQRQSDY